MERKHLIPSAGFWYKVAKNPTTVTKSDERIFAMEQAYNHAENAVVWLLEKATPEVKAQFLKIQNKK